MELAIKVGHGSLQRMAHTREDAQRPDEPSVLLKEMRSCDAVSKVQFPEHQSETDGSKPKVTAHTVENATHTGILLRHARQLTVGTVKRVGPSDEQHAHPIEPCQIGLMEIKHHATCHTHEDAGDSDGIGAHAQFLKQFGPQEAQGTMKMEVKPFLGVRRLE